MGKLTARMSPAGFKALGTWFDRQKRVLPWRDEPTVYRVWISEIMLQQTQVATVVPYFERFMERFPTVERLAQASEEEVLKFWAGLGYYSRGRNLRIGAQKIVQSGSFPATRDEWLEIPGVGDYTAGAILSISSDAIEAILDGNVERVLSRVHRVTRAAGDAAYKARLWKLAEEFVSGAHRAGVRPSVCNQALMELGAMVCTPRGASCERCPLARSCAARARGDVESFPPKKKPKQWLEVREELHCVLDGSGRVLLRLREKGEWRAGLWDLLEKAPSGARKLGAVESRHVVTRHKITRMTQIWIASRAKKCKTDLRWIAVENPEVPTGSALKKTLQRVRESFPETLGSRS